MRGDSAGDGGPDALSRLTAHPMARGEMPGSRRWETARVLTGTACPTAMGGYRGGKDKVGRSQRTAT